MFLADKDIEMEEVADFEKIEKEGQWAYCDLGGDGFPMHRSGEGEPRYLAVMLPTGAKVTVSLWPVVGPDMRSWAHEKTDNGLTLEPEVHDDMSHRWSIADGKLLQRIKMFSVVISENGVVPSQDRHGLLCCSKCGHVIETGACTCLPQPGTVLGDLP